MEKKRPLRTVLAAYRITNWNGQEITGIESHPALPKTTPAFDLKAYSRFKYGEQSYADLAGSILASLFISVFPTYFETADECSSSSSSGSSSGTSLLVTESPYHCVPGAATGLKLYFLNHINKVRVSKGLSTVPDTKINRLKAFAGDYSELGVDERVKRMKTTARYYVDSALVKGKHLIVIDDCKISGSHIENIYQELQSTEVAQVTFIILVEAFDKCPCSIETFLNHSSVNDLSTWSIVQQLSSTRLTQRSIKFLLRSKESESKILSELAKLPLHFLTGIYYGIINDGLSEDAEMRRNFNLVQQCWRQRTFQANY